LRVLQLSRNRTRNRRSNLGLADDDGRVARGCREPSAKQCPDLRKSS
jgi:hypothetical protein